MGDFAAAATNVAISSADWNANAPFDFLRNIFVDIVTEWWL
jgi:hypothetical protein